MKVQYRIKKGKVFQLRTLEVDLTELLEETIAEWMDVQVEAIEVTDINMEESDEE